jgi:beta-glucosidase/6-phospho-beta-glucosidase/beta-galactosidase
VHNNIQPVVSLVHWDFPQPLQNQGGFLSSSIVNRFADYADLCFRTFGDRVKRGRGEIDDAVLLHCMDHSL